MLKLTINGVVAKIYCDKFTDQRGFQVTLMDPANGAQSYTGFFPSDSMMLPFNLDDHVVATITIDKDVSQPNATSVQSAS